MMVNLELNGKNVNNHSRIAKINKENNECILERLPNTESRTALLNNIFASNGLPGKVSCIFILFIVIYENLDNFSLKTLRDKNLRMRCDHR